MSEQGGDDDDHDDHCQQPEQHHDVELYAAARVVDAMHLVLVNDSIPADFDIQVASLGGAVVAMYPEIGVAVTAGLSDTAAAQLAQASFVSGIERDQMVQWVPGPEDLHLEAVEAAEPSVQTNQSGAFFFNFWQWNIRQIDANDAWAPTNAGAGTRVAILDTGTDPGHLDLIGKVDLAASRSFVVGSPCGPADDTDILDRHFHGTFVSGIVTSRGIGMASVAPDARIIAVKVLSCSGGGSITRTMPARPCARTSACRALRSGLGRCRERSRRSSLRGQVCAPAPWRTSLCSAKGRVAHQLRG